MSNFYPFEVVGRGSETQRQMGEKLFVYIAFYELTGYIWPFSAFYLLFKQTHFEQERS